MTLLKALILALLPALAPFAPLLMPETPPAINLNVNGNANAPITIVQCPQ